VNQIYNKSKSPLFLTITIKWRVKVQARQTVSPNISMATCNSKLQLKKSKITTVELLAIHRPLPLVPRASK
jgi:hypothetical protein